MVWWVGKAIEKITEWIPSPEQKRRRDIAIFKRKIDELQKQPATTVNLRLMDHYSKRVSELEKAAVDS